MLQLLLFVATGKTVFEYEDISLPFCRPSEFMQRTETCYCLDRFMAKTMRVMPTCCLSVQWPLLWLEWQTSLLFAGLFTAPSVVDECIAMETAKLPSRRISKVAKRLGFQR